MKPREYIIMRDCVGVGIQRGWAKAHKHHENPTPGQIQAAIEDAVILSITEYFTFEEDVE